MPTSHRPNCPAPHCRIRNRHLSDCPDNSGCPGCLPRPARDGLILCDVDTNRIQTDAARCAVLHRDLEQVLIGGAVIGEQVASTGGGPPAPNDEVMAARNRIRFVLAKTSALIVRERGVRAPDDRIPALARFVAMHREWLAAHRHAVMVAVALRELAGDGHLWAITYPAGSDRMYIGDCPAILTDDAGGEELCGARLYQDPAQPLIACANCGVEDTVEQWQRWICGDDVREHHADSLAIARRLSLMWMRPVDPGVIRQWAHRGKVAPVLEPDPDDGEKQRPKRDDRNRVLYDWTVVVAYARDLWGPEAPVRGRRAA